MKTIEQNLKETCRLKGLSLTDVANRMGTTPSNLLSSVKGNPTISKLQDIASALQVSVSELLTQRPDKALGIVFIAGQSYQLSKPATNTVQLPSYYRFDMLRGEIKGFIKKCIDDSVLATKMGIVETMEVFSLVYDPNAAKFYLSLCYAEGKTCTIVYDKFEYCNWEEGDTVETVKWTLSDVTEEIISDIEEAAISRLQIPN